MISEYKLTIRIPKELHRAVKVKAAQEGRPISAVIRELLEEWLEKTPEEAKTLDELPTFEDRETTAILIKRRPDP